MQIRRVTDPNDPAILAFGALQNSVYFEPEMLIPAGYIRQILQDTAGERRNVLLLAEADDATADDATANGSTLLGGTLFHYLPESQTGFSSFLGVALSARGQGVARRLHDARWQALSELSGGGCRALFIDVVNPERESAAQRELERQSGSDALQRRRSFHALSFRTVDLAYEQPVGGDDPELDGGGPVTDMDLLAYCPGGGRTIPAALVAATMRAYWTPWLGQERAEAAARKLQAGQGEVALLPAWQGPAARG